MRTSELEVVIQTASAEAAVQLAPATAIVATTLFDAGSMRSTPSSPVAQIDPNAPTTPIDEPSLKRFTTLFCAGSIRSTSPLPCDVAQSAPKAKVESYGWKPTFTAAVRLPVAAETRLIVFEVVSSTHSEPAPNPSPHEPLPIPIFFTTLFVFGLIFRR